MRQGHSYHVKVGGGGVAEQKFLNDNDFCLNLSDSNQDICYLTKQRRQQKLTRKPA